MAAADRDALLSWSRAFMETHGRRPTRADMPEDVGEKEREAEKREREAGNQNSVCSFVDFDRRARGILATEQLSPIPPKCSTLLSRKTQPNPHTQQ